MNEFTDDDLKRVKKNLSMGTSDVPLEPRKNLLALIVRLQAAEKVCNGYMDMKVDGPKLDSLWEAWRKKCGK